MSHFEEVKPPYRFEIDRVTRTSSGFHDVEYSLKRFDTMQEALEFKAEYEAKYDIEGVSLRIEKRLPDAAEMNPDFAGMII